MPLLALIVPISTAAPLIALTASTIALIILIRRWQHVQWQGAWRLILFTIVGIPFGLWLLKGVHDDILKFILAVVLIVFSSFRLFRPERWTFESERSAPCFGFIAGILGGAYNTNGPPIIIYGSLRKWTPESFRATLQGYFFPTGIFILAGHAISGLWTAEIFRLYVTVLPFLLAAVWLGGKLHSRLPQRIFQRLVIILLLCIGVGLFIQTLK